MSIQRFIIHLNITTNSNLNHLKLFIVTIFNKLIRNFRTTKFWQLMLSWFKHLFQTKHWQFELQGNEVLLILLHWSISWYLEARRGLVSWNHFGRTSRRLKPFTTDPELRQKLRACCKQLAKNNPSPLYFPFPDCTLEDKLFVVKEPYHFTKFLVKEFDVVFSGALKNCCIIKLSNRFWIIKRLESTNW